MEINLKSNKRRSLNLPLLPLCAPRRIATLHAHGLFAMLMLLHFIAVLPQAQVVISCEVRDLLSSLIAAFVCQS